MESQVGLIGYGFGAVAAFTTAGVTIALTERRLQGVLAATIAGMGLVWVTAIVCWNMALLTADSMLARSDGGDVRGLLFWWLAIAPGAGAFAGAVLGLAAGGGRHTEQSKNKQTTKEVAKEPGTPANPEG